MSAFGKSATTIADGTFSLPGLPTIQGPITVTAAVVVNGTALGGSSAAMAPVVGGFTNVGDITVAPIPVITLMSSKSALFNTVIPSLTVTGSNLAGATFSFPTSAITVTSTSTSPSGTSATLSLSIGSQAGTSALVATNAFGSSTAVVTPSNRFTVVDPSSTALGANGFFAAIDAVFWS